MLKYMLRENKITFTNVGSIVSFCAQEVYLCFRRSLLNSLKLSGEVGVFMNLSDSLAPFWVYSHQPMYLVASSLVKWLTVLVQAFVLLK